MADAKSESAVLNEIQAFAAEIIAHSEARGPVRHAASRIAFLALDLLRQVEQGIHRNPPLVLYGNPPLRARRDPHSLGRGDPVDAIRQQVMSVNVHELRYTHRDDEQDYRHQFEDAVVMWATVSKVGREHTLYLQGRRGQSLWEDF